MGLLVLTSASGAPGVTTLAVGLTLVWPRSVVLADCDPGGHQAVLAGFLRGQSRTSKGLLRVAEAHRDRRPMREVVMDQTIPLAEDAKTLRAFLPGFNKPGSAALFGPVWNDLIDTFKRLDDAGIDVIIDAGRLGPNGLPTAMIENADLICLLTRTSLRALASARIHAPTLIEQGRLAAAEENLGLILVGEGKPYQGKEVSQLLGLPVVSQVADDPRSATSISEGTPRTRKFDQSPFAKSLHTSSVSLSRRLHDATERIGV